MRKALRFLLKALMLPVILLFWLLHTLGAYVVAGSGVILNVIAFLLLLLDIVCVAFGEASRQQAIWLMAASAFIFMIPWIAGHFVTGIAAINMKMIEYLHS